MVNVEREEQIPQREGKPRARQYLELPALSLDSGTHTA